MGDLAQTVYWLDPQDRISRVCPAWDGFALSNEGPAVVAAAVQGRLIWDFISGDEARTWLRVLLMQAKTTGRVVSRPYRCDSPRLRRFMQMTITPLPTGEVELQHVVVRTEERVSPVHFRGTRVCRGQLRRRCSVCGKIESDQGWVEPETVCQVIDAACARQFTVAYGVCDACLSTLPMNAAA